MCSLLIRRCWQRGLEHARANGYLHGIIYGMKTTIDSAGRLIIPKEIRKVAGLKPGMPLEVTLHEGHIEIAPVPQRIRLVKKGRLLVAEPDSDVPPLDAKTVDETLKQLRQKRSGSR
jgi:AbrB family looped-hinge helix DNA binding protein